MSNLLTTEQMQPILEACGDQAAVKLLLLHIERLTGLLSGWSDHLPGCDTKTEGWTCSCGYADVQLEMEDAAFWREE